jgi:hypothetical protein
MHAKTAAVVYGWRGSKFNVQGFKVIGRQIVSYRSANRSHRSTRAITRPIWKDSPDTASDWRHGLRLLPDVESCSSPSGNRFRAAIEIHAGAATVLHAVFQSETP